MVEVVTGATPEEVKRMQSLTGELVREIAGRFSMITGAPEPSFLPLLIGVVISDISVVADEAIREYIDGIFEEIKARKEGDQEEYDAAYAKQKAAIKVIYDSIVLFNQEIQGKA